MVAYYSLVYAAIDQKRLPARVGRTQVRMEAGRLVEEYA